MKSARYARSRQKACQQCSNAKARCDRKAGDCKRCIQRSLYCSLPPALSSDSSAQSLSVINDAEPYSPLSALNSICLLPTPERELPNSEDPHGRIVELGQALNSNTPSSSFSKYVMRAPFEGGQHLPPTVIESRNSEVLDFSSLELVCPINVEEISNRWLNAYIPDVSQVVKEYPTNIKPFIYQILKSYAAVAINGRGVPPFVHSAQLLALAANPPLSACLSLIRICERTLPGSAGVAIDVLEREMHNIYEQRKAYDDIALLGAAQAYLIYAMVLFFRLGQDSNPVLRQAMMNLQEIACFSSQNGLMCIAEQQHVRPRWEAWILVEAKRRTLYTMYLFDSVLSAQEGIPTYLATELEGLPAPANKDMWEAKARQDWERVYNIYLVEWMNGGLRIDELWPVPAGLDEHALNKRRNRVDEWLQNIDEFGTMLYAITCCTHGG